MKTNKNGPALIAYIRVSTDEQARGGVSLAAQRTRIAAYARAMGHDLVGFEEDTVSGKVAPMKRPGLCRALARVRSGEATGLVVFKLDRLSRSTRDILDLADEAKRRGWQLLSMSEQLDTSNACGQFVLTIFGALAEMERKQIGERTRVGMAEVARQGRARSRWLPFGYRIKGNLRSIEASRGDKRPLIEYPPEQRVLARILAMKRGGKGAWKIARELNEAGEVNPRTKRAWSVGALAGIMRTAAQRTA
ncbi:MAG: recombinase family protein [Deltaproteobacteria bacterium]|nr:recombinase family protein [Deltaproteobacteria bacterium]